MKRIFHHFENCLRPMSESLNSYCFFSKVCNKISIHTNVMNIIFLSLKKIFQGRTVEFDTRSRRITRGGRGSGLPCLFSEIGKNALIFVIYGCNFSFSLCLDSNNTYTNYSCGHPIIAVDTPPPAPPPAPLAIY